MQVAIAIQKILMVIAINVELFVAIKNARRNNGLQNKILYYLAGSVGTA